MDPNIFMHESDRAALNALKAIPGFTALFKAFMKVWSEKQFQIQNMSSNLRISEKQLSKYYDMLPPICQKLGIEVPDLFLELDVSPNAYTAGDTKPFIVITSGLLEHVPEDLIPTVLAHECGHIACHHCLYTTMGRMILSGAISYLGIGELAALPIQIAFAYWMRCSEFSADRAAAICDGNADKVVRMCMHFSGLSKELVAQANVYEFMQQANDYRRMILDSRWNKAMEFLLFHQADHPLNAVRAAECFEWAAQSRFGKIRGYLAQANASSASDSTALALYMQEVLMPENENFYISKHVSEAERLLRALGFVNIRTVRNMEPNVFYTEKQVVHVRINGSNQFRAYDFIPIDAQIEIEYYYPKTEAEIAAEHPGQIKTPNSSRHYFAMNYQIAAQELRAAGFKNIVLIPKVHPKKGFLSIEGTIDQITINGNSFAKDEWHTTYAIVHIVYDTYPVK
ncbi:MAG: M48 family metallopeptidase [Clostridia bacterium]|nr:M48 family metallopeptidase [Clostridia bacterium]